MPLLQVKLLSFPAALKDGLDLFGIFYRLLILYNEHKW